MLAEWILAAAPGLKSDEDEGRRFSSLPPRLAEEYDVDLLEALEAAVTAAPNPLAAAKEARAWQEMIAPSQVNRGGSGELPCRTRARHILGLVGCCPTSEMEDMFPSLARELLALLRRRDGGYPADVETRAVALAAVDELVRRMLENPVAPGVGDGIANKFGRKESGGARQAVVSVLPKLVPLVAACLEGSTSSDDGSSVVPPPPVVAMGALGVLEALAFLLRSTMRPHVKRLQDVTALWLQGPDNAIRDRAAAVLASLPLCSEGDAWKLAAGKVSLEAHGLLQMVWPDDDVDMGSDMGPSQVNEYLSASGGLLPHLGAGADGFPGPQQALAVLVVRRFKGLCRVLELMLSGDSDGRVVAVPVPLILALVERVQRMNPNLKGKGPQAFVPVAQGALSHGALRTIYPALSITTSRLLDALAATPLPTVLRNGRRFCRALIQCIARPSTTGTLRAAGYRSIARAMVQLGAGAALDLAMPALPALLEEVRVIVEASDSQTMAGVRGSIAASGVTTSTASMGAIIMRETTAAGGATASGGMHIEPAMSARKSSQKKQRKLREKEVSRALAAADAAAAPPGIASATGSMSLSNGVVAVVRGRGGSTGAGSLNGATALMEREAVCSAIACMARLVGCCRGHLPLAGRLAVEDVLHRGLGILARVEIFGGSVGGVAKGAPPGAAKLSRLLEPPVTREFIGLAQECLLTPLADGTRSGALSIALAAFRSLGSHPDERLAAASQRALSACGSILYPRAAPLHLPHAVTSQARAWGSKSVDSHELPSSWGSTLAGAGTDDIHDDAESEHIVRKHDRAGSSRGMFHSLDWASPETTTIVTASAETLPGLRELTLGDSSSRDNPTSADSLESVANHDDDENALEEVSTSKGKGKGRETVGSGNSTDSGDTETIAKSSSRASLEIGGQSGAKEASGDKGDAQRSKRRRLNDKGFATATNRDDSGSDSHVEVDANNTEKHDYDGVGHQETSPTQVTRGEVCVDGGGHQSSAKGGSTAIAGRGQEADNRSEIDEGDDDGTNAIDGRGQEADSRSEIDEGDDDGTNDGADDDDLDFPSIVDADPDSE